MLIKILLLNFSLCIPLFAQTYTGKSSFLDEIDLVFGIEAGIVSTFNKTSLLDGRTYENKKIAPTISFAPIPVINIQLGLRGFNYLLEGYYRDSFFKYSAQGYQTTQTGEKITKQFQNFLNYGVNFSYFITKKLSIGLLYENYIYVNSGNGITITEPLTANLRNSATFTQVKIATTSQFKIKKINILTSLNLTLFSLSEKIKYYSFIMLNDQKPFIAWDDYKHYYKRNPFNLQIKIGILFNFNIYPFISYEFLTFDGDYNIHMFSLNLKFQMPYLME